MKPKLAFDLSDSLSPKKRPPPYRQGVPFWLHFQTHQKVHKDEPSPVLWVA